MALSYDISQDSANFLATFGTINSLLYGIKDIFVESMERELDIPPVSKYKLLDLRNILYYVCNNGRDGFDKKEIKVYFQLENSHYNHPELYIEWSYLYSFLGKNDKAIKFVQKKLENATEREKEFLYSRLLNLYSKYDKLKSCEEYVDKDDLNRALGFAAINDKNYELAVEKAILANDGGIYQCQQLGYAYFKLEKYEEAAKAFKLGIRKHDITGDNGFGVNCYLEAGCAHYNEKKYDEALEWLNKGVKYYNNDTFIARYHYLKGLCYEKMGDNEEYVQKSREEYSKAVRYRYHWEPLYNKLAKEYARIGEKEKAVEVLKIGLEVTGSSGDYQDDEIENIYYDLFVIYADYHKDYNKAIEYLELMKNKTKYEYFKKDYWYRLGLVYILMGEKEKMKEDNMQKANETLNNSVFFVKTIH